MVKYSRYLYTHTQNSYSAILNYLKQQDKHTQIKKKIITKIKRAIHRILLRRFLISEIDKSYIEVI